MEIFKGATAQYLQNAHFSDFTIAFAGKEYKVHRAIISAHSKYFERACLGSFQERNASRIELKEDDADAVTRMIDYFYKFDYDDNLVAPHCAIVLNAQVYAVAEKYDVQGLKKLSAGKYATAVRAGCKDSLKLAKAAQTVYSSILVPRGELGQLKAILVALWLSLSAGQRTSRIADLEATDAQGRELRQLYKDNVDFSFDVQMASLKGISTIQECVTMILGIGKPQSK